MLGMEAVPALIFIGAALHGAGKPAAGWRKRGRSAEARAILARIGGGAANWPTVELGRDSKPRPARRKGVLSELCHQRLPPAVDRGRRVDDLLQFCGINAIMYYSTKIFESCWGGGKTRRLPPRLGRVDQPGLHLCGHCLGG